LRANYELQKEPMMELVIVILGLAGFAAAAGFRAADTRPGLDDEPRRAI
jgi:hypothetical protein